MSNIPKRRFDFEPYNGEVDIYVNGKKIRNKHRGLAGNIALRIPEDVQVDVSAAVHNPKIGVDFELTDDGLEPIEHEPQLLPSRQQASNDRATEAEKLRKEKFEETERIQLKVQKLKEERRIKAQKDKAAKLAALKIKEPDKPLKS